MATEEMLAGTWRCAETRAIYNVYEATSRYRNILGPKTKYVVFSDSASTSPEEFFQVVCTSGRVKLRLLRGPMQLDHCYELDRVNSTETTLIWIGVTAERVMTWRAFNRQVWKTLIIQLSSEAEADGTRLKCSKITGEMISSCFIPCPSTTSWLQARLLMTPGLRPLLSKSRLAFVSPDGANLTRADDDRCIDDIFSVADTLELTTPPKRRRINLLPGCDSSDKERLLLNRQCNARNVRALENCSEMRRATGTCIMRF
eukprot:TRINITY_DN36028_c0_g1_i1.p1 TRINITY_DN36028_c0_g1~~TRINITY_DN36028_c0_g1_i1.p1  ORF type:complete len:266 (+),score=36.07 TRINITY_DN36028_c0_g1_i1:26-799(+)